jgi:hypothetical protein
MHQLGHLLSLPQWLCIQFDSWPQVVDEAATTKKRQEAEEVVKAKGEDVGQVQVEPVMKSDKKKEWDWAVQNGAKPIWTRNPKEVTTLPMVSLFGGSHGGRKIQIYSGRAGLSGVRQQ